MALVVKDRVKQTTTTTGTGNIVLNGNVDGFQTFAAALADGDTTYFGIFVPSTNDYEVGLGTWTEGSATLARTTILESSNSGSAINITAQAEVFITQPAEKAVFQDANGDVDLGGNKILFGNLYSTTGDLPSASTYHGMFAHVHGTGKAYYAHGGNWIELVNEDTSGDVSMGGNLTVTGDLTVNGTTTTVNTTNTVVTDTLIELGNGTSGSPSNDAGIVIERGSSDNAFIGYDESADKFTVGTGSFTGATTGNLTISTGTLVANVEGNVTGNVTGNVSGSSGSTTGNAATATQATNADTVDSLHASQFVRSDAADSMSGQLLINSNTSNPLELQRSSQVGIELNDTSVGSRYLGVNSGNLRYGSNLDHSQNSLIWHSTNDGTGSGLDADLLDGVQGSSYLRSDANDTFTGTLTVSGSAVIDDITINGSTISDGGDLDIDVGGQISLDSSNNGYVRLKDDGTQYGLFYKSGDDFMIYSSVSDGDMKFTGNDGGSFFTALTLDMSDAGAATFNAGANFGGNVDINGNLNAVDDIYMSNALFHEGDTDTHLSFGTDLLALTTGGTARVYVSSSGVQLGDTGNGYFRPVSGTYGSVEIDGGAHNGWEGYSIGGLAAFMTDSTSHFGLYNDGNDQWAIRATYNGATELYYQGGSKIQTHTSGVNIDGDLEAVDNITVADDIIHEGDTDTKIAFTTDTIDLYTGNTQARFNVNGLFMYDGSVHEDYDALSGTTPTINAFSAGAFSLTMSGNTTFTFSSVSSGSSTGFILQLTGNGSTVTWPGAVKWAGGTAPDAPANGETDILVFHTRDGGTNWYGVLASDAAS